MDILPTIPHGLEARATAATTLSTDLPEYIGAEHGPVEQFSELVNRSFRLLLGGAAPRRAVFASSAATAKRQ
jgi:hypothetical protein